VGEAAEQAGIRVLFTSEPTAAVKQLGQCHLIGRYVVRRGMPPDISAAFASGRLAPRLRQTLAWNARKIVKAVAGDTYLRVRRAMFEDK
jgi:hypothetical protein